MACGVRSGSAVASVSRARCSELLTAAVVVSSCSATSRAEKPSTSRRISTARWRGGEVLQRGDERELDALALLDARPSGAIG